MTNMNQAAIQTEPAEQLPEPVLDVGEIVHEQQCRAIFYGLLAGLLRNVPGQSVLNEVSELASVKPSESELTLAMSMLGLAATTCSVESVSDEYHELFIGLGRGELMPYGSWYQTGFLMERPLGDLRDDLAALGFQRTADTHEPEDHVAALCEVMMLMISEGTDESMLSQFFNTHMAEWIERFFKDLSEAQGAVFFRAVGRFGMAFIAIEKRQLSMQV